MADESSFALLLPDNGAASSSLPVVVLMGWVGAQRDGALLKYAEFLAAQGYASVRSVQPTAVAFSPFDGPRRRWALALLAFLRAHSLWPQRQLILYAFSNGGAFVVEQLLLLSESGDASTACLPDTVAGFIFDSAPAYMHPGALQRVLAETEPPGLQRTLKMAYYTVATRLFSRDAASFWGNMQRLSWGRPLLFLYSSDDPLADGKKISELVEEKKARGQRVSARQWEQSAHVGHFRRHREEYTALLLDFLRQVGGGHAAGGEQGAAGGTEAGQAWRGGAAGIAPRARL